MTIDIVYTWVDSSCKNLGWRKKRKTNRICYKTNLLLHILFVFILFVVNCNCGASYKSLASFIDLPRWLLQNTLLNILSMIDKPSTGSLLIDKGMINFLKTNHNDKTVWTNIVRPCITTLHNHIKHAHILHKPISMF